MRRVSRQPTSFSKRARALAGKAHPAAEDGNLGARALRSREQLIEGAVKLFLEKGYGGTTIHDIAVAAGMSHASFYTYFSGKRDLLMLAGLRSRQSSVQQLKLISKIPEEWKHEHLQNWIKSYFSYLEVHGGFRLVWKEATTADDELREMGTKSLLRTARIVGMNLQRLGASAEVDARIQGVAVIGMMEQSWYVWRKGPGPSGEDGLIDGLARMLGALLRQEKAAD